MLKNYELLYILHPDLEGSSDKISEKVASFITKSGGEVTNQEDWGKRKLAYPISKNDFGVYVLVNFTVESEKLPEIEHDLGLSEEVMRFMVVILPEIVESKKKSDKKAKAQEKASAKEEKKEEKPAKVVEEKESPVAEEIKEEKPKKVTKKATPKAEKTEEVAETPKAEEKPKAKKATKKAEKPEAEEKERLKKLDEKLEEILGE